MEKIIRPGFVEGQITAPASKSMTQRAIAAAALAEGTSTITNPSYCHDSLAGISIARNLGAEITQYNDKLIIKGSKKLNGSILDCGESGLAIRLYSPVAALKEEKITLTGRGSLAKRPMGMIEDALKQLGVSCDTAGGFLPLTIKGPVKAGKCTIDGSVSSQLLTGMLMALPLAGGDSEITVLNLKSKPYIDMTLQLLNDFGITIISQGYRKFHIPGNQKYSTRSYEVEGDWSGGAFLLVAGALNGNIKVKGLRTDSKQSDTAIMKALKSAGADLHLGADFIGIKNSPLKAFEFDATECPDLFPPLAALAANCKGTTSIKGVSRLVFKESNRAEALKEEFGKMNIRIELQEDIMHVSGGKPSGARVRSHNDHRIAMALAVMALIADGNVTVEGSECVGKSYPEFFNDLLKTGAVVD
jgi:3-phosphoshikimate 1-carboxyvinyltransferase